MSRLLQSIFRGAAIVSLTTSALALETLHEGRRRHVYQDSKGHPTVGIGFNLDRQDASARFAALGLDYDAVKSGELDLTDAQIDRLTSIDVDDAIASAKALCPSFDTLPEQIRLVLVDQAFNLGKGGLANFVSKALDCCKE